MTAPQTSPELSVVSPGTHSESAAGESARSPADPASTGGPRPAATPGRRVPIWVVLAVAAAGAILFATQYQRAEKLSARVVSLAAELEESTRQITAYESHLVAIRGGVGDLSARMAGLQALVNRNPLAEPEGPASGGEQPRNSAEGIVGPALSTPFAPLPGRLPGAQPTPRPE